MNNSRDNSNPSPSFFGAPRTRLGWWSIVLSSSFFALFLAWLMYVKATPKVRPTFFSDPLHAFLLIGASATAIIGGILGLLALVAKRERSFTILLSILVGGFVLFWTIAELGGH